MVRKVRTAPNPSADDTSGTKTYKVRSQRDRKTNCTSADSAIYRIWEVKNGSYQEESARTLIAITWTIIGARGAKLIRMSAETDVQEKKSVKITRMKRIAVADQ